MDHFIFSHIVAASSNNVIGVQNELPWNIPEDMKFFREKTRGHTIIMGRKTFESLGSPLPKRNNIVISRSTHTSNQQNVYWTTNIEKAMQMAQEISPLKEIFIIGGGEIYKQSINKVQRIYLTRIYKEYQGDAFYPEVPLNQFKISEEKKHDGDPAFSFMTYERI